MKNILTIDLESWFHFDVEFFRKFGGKLNKRLDDNFIVDATKLLLRLLEEYNQKATFFVLGEVYQWYPALIKEVKKGGHEIAYHGHNHKKLLNKKILEKQLALSCRFLDEFKPKGFRAPDIYFKKEYFSLLEKHQFYYDSSSYGCWGQDLERIDGVFEVPISSFVFRKNLKEADFPRDFSWRLLLREIPFGSGYFLCLLKDKISIFVERLNRQQIPALLLIHPWQIYSNPLSGSRFRVRYFWKNPAAVLYSVKIIKEFEKLLIRYKFTTIEDFLRDFL